MDSNSELGQLVPCGGGDPIPLFKQRLVIGRRENCDIVLEYPNISSQHCALELQNGYWHVRDLRSRNGIKVNGERTDSKFLLPGDELSIAKHRFEIEYQPAADAPPPPEENPFELSLLEKAGLMREQEERRRAPLPPAARRPAENGEKKDYSDDENQAADWLMDDA
ncbi:MAG: FHA domain-containing protein [Planctomyces sp.]|nr:FHA domain-containing protein [Planctomyces sp.]